MNIPNAPERPPYENQEGSGKSFLAAMALAVTSFILIFISDIILSRPKINILISGNKSLAFSALFLITIFVIFELASIFSGSARKVLPTTRRIGFFGFINSIAHALAIFFVLKNKVAMESLGSFNLSLTLAKASLFFLFLTFIGCAGFVSKKFCSRKNLFLQIMGTISLTLIIAHAVLIMELTPSRLLEIIGTTEIFFIIIFLSGFILAQIILYSIGKHLSLKGKILSHTILYFILNFIILGLYLIYSDTNRHREETFRENRNSIEFIKQASSQNSGNIYKLGDTLTNASNSELIIFFLNKEKRVAHHPEKKEEDKTYLGIEDLNKTSDGYGWDIRYKKEETEFLDTVATLPDGNYVVASTNQTKHAVSFNKQIVYGIGIALVAILTSMTVTLLFIQKNILEPIRRIIQASSRMVKGDLDARVSIDTNDDIATLAEIYNTLSQKMQEQINDLLKMDKLKNEFIAIASHNLRTPLTTMRGYLDMLLSEKTGKLNKKQKSMLDRVSGSATSLASLTEGLVNITALETEGVRLEKNEIDLKKIIEQSIESVNEKARLKKLKVENNLGKEPIMTIGDEPKLRQAFLSVLDNAVKFNKDGGDIIIEKIVDDTKEKTIGRREVIIKITDTGIGISKEEKENVFQKFNRGTSTYTYQYEGVGLGLYIAKLIIQAHHGRIWFESASDKGTTFYISLTTTSQNVKSKEERKLK